ncbi:F-box protein DOR-like isoform X2 [Capsella rubella]|nr:F-box protein DOR-like isoform X2 [Capsella rubella]
MMKTWRRSEYSDLIPIDLIFEILSSLPAKSVARFRSVSKLWGSIISRIDFTELFLTKSSGRPQLLFTCVKSNELFFFSTPQTCENWFPVVAAEYHMKLRCDPFRNILNPISGLVCFHDKRGDKSGLLETVICNPSTGQSFTLPKMKTRGRVALMSSFLGYDPVEKHFKVLAMTFPSGDDGISEEHQVLTLGGTGSWGMIQCCIPHCPGFKV